MHYVGSLELNCKYQLKMDIEALRYIQIYIFHYDLSFSASHGEYPLDHGCLPLVIIYTVIIRLMTYRISAVSIFNLIETWPAIGIINTFNLRATIHRDQGPNLQRL